MFNEIYSLYIKYKRFNNAMFKFNDLFSKNYISYDTI